MTYHFSETLGFEIEGGYAVNADRQDKTTLKDDFAINTVLLRPQSLANARVVWTPSYGKFNLGSSEILYFDTDVILGAGMTAIRYEYDYCAVALASQTKQYPTYVGGLGQRYFLSPSSSLRIGIEDQHVMVQNRRLLVPRRRITKR